MQTATNLRRLALFLALSLAFTGISGCATSNTGPQSFLGRIFGRKAIAADKENAKVDRQEDQTVTAAQLEVVKTRFALASAPQSRPVEVATRTNENAFSLLNQRSPLTVGQMGEAQELVRGLLSEEAAKREAAEKKQAEAEKSIAKLSEELASTREHAKKLTKERDAEAARNLELANELRMERLQKWAGVGLSALLTLATIAYRLNVGRLQEGAAEAIVRLRKQHGDAVADTAIGGIDWATDKGSQSQIAKMVFALSKKS